MKIPVFKPYLGSLEIEAAVRSLELGWLGPGSFVKEFETGLASLLEVNPENVVAVNTGTSAVHLGLKLCGVGAGDEVITPSFNNIADFQMIKSLHANPVFCDVTEDSLTMDVRQLPGLISNKTKAIICLDYGSSLCDYEAIEKIAKQHSIPVLYDAAHSFGSSTDRGKVGSYSDISAFSFDPVKNITCIDGGAVIVKSKEQAEKIRYMRLLGQKQNQDKLYANNRSWTYDVDELGYRYHLANLHAAIGVEQLKKFEEIARKRRELFKFYHQELKDVEGLKLPLPVQPGIVPFIFVIRVLNNRRSDFTNFLHSNGVDTGIHWQPGHRFTLLKNCKAADLSITNKIADEIVTLPFYPDLSMDEAKHITDIIKQFYVGIKEHD